MSKKSIAVWGTGKRARKFICMYRSKFDIVCCYDNSANDGKRFCEGVPVRKYDSNETMSIMIASSFWNEIVSQLMEDGKIVGKDIFIDVFIKNIVKYEDWVMLSRLIGNQKFDAKGLAMGRKVSMVYGNCQTRVVENVLTYSDEFNQEYWIISIPRIYEWDKGYDLQCFLGDSKLWDMIELFVYQHVADTNTYSLELSTSRIMNRLSGSCRKVSILNLYFLGYFMQYEPNNNNYLKDIEGMGLLHWRDKYVDELIEQGYPKEKILSLINCDSFIEGSEIEKKSQESLNELMARERGVDVKIVEYIEANFRGKQLFHSVNHPCKSLMIEYANRILEYIGYDRVNISEEDVWIRSLKATDIPIYPAVIKYLNMEKWETKYYPNRWMANDLVLSFDDYIEMYIALNTME